MQRNMAALENRPDANRELLTAIVTFFEAKALAPLLVLNSDKRVDAPNATAMRTDRAIFPDDSF